MSGSQPNTPFIAPEAPFAVPQFTPQAAPVAPAQQPVQVQPVAAPIEYASPVAIPNTVRPAHTLQTFADNLMELIAQLINEGKIDQNYLESLKKYFGVKEIWNVLASANKTREMYESFAKYGFITMVNN